VEHKAPAEAVKTKVDAQKSWAAIATNTSSAAAKEPNSMRVELELPGRPPYAAASPAGTHWVNVPALHEPNGDLNVNTAAAYMRYCFGFIVLASFYTFTLRWNIGRQPLMGKNKAKKLKSSDWSEDGVLNGVMDLGDLGSKEVMKKRAEKEADAKNVKNPMLPTIWPKFGKLRDTTKVYIPYDKMQQPQFHLHIFGSTASPLVSVAIKKKEDGTQLLQFSNVGLGGILLASVASDTLEIHGLGKVLLGHFKADTDGKRMTMLAVGDERKMCSISKDVEGARIEIAAIDDGTVHATAERREACPAVPYSHYEVTTEQNVDVVFALAAVMTLLTFVK